MNTALVLRLAEQTIRTLDLSIGVEHEYLQPWANSVWTSVRAVVAGFSPPVLGVIACSGQGYDTARTGSSLYEVHLGTWLGKRESGMDLVIDIATSALIALMYDTLTGTGR